MDFYIGDQSNASGIRRMDVNLFSRTPGVLHFSRFYKAYHWYGNSIGLVLKGRYKKYVMTGEPICISSWLILLLGKILRKDISLWSHGFYGKEGRSRKFIKRLYFSLASRVLLYGNHSRLIMIGLGFHPNKLLVLYNSLFYTRQLSIRESRLKIPVEPLFSNLCPTVIFVGRLTKDKNVQLLIEALNVSLLKERIRFNILIVGEGSEKEKILNLIDQNGLQLNVKMVGACYDEELLASYFHASDICVSPGEVGLTGIHSMSYGTPVITHDDFGAQMPEFEAIQKGINGDFFRRNDADDLSLVIDRWLERFPQKSEDVRKNCFEVVDHYYNPYKQINTFSFLKE